MATRIKTIEYAMETKATLADNTLTALNQMTMYIPEFSGTVTFKSVVATVSVKEGATMTTGNYSTRRVDISVGGATALGTTNSNVLNGSGENTTTYFSADVTSHFVSNWTTGTSKTLDASVLVDSTATTIAMVDVDVTVFITYEYDDTQTTQIKTVYIPLDAPVTTLNTSKPGTATATIPLLNTELPESSKTFRHMHIVAQGNINNTASTVDGTVSMQIDSLTAFTSSTLEFGATSDYYTRFVWNIDSLSLDTSASHSFYLWAQQARFNHPQTYLVVTYEFDASGSTGCYNSVMLPATSGGIMGGTSSSDFQRLTATLWIEEPATITTKSIAFYAFWDAEALISGLNMRVGTGSFVTYTDGANVYGGSAAAMVRNDSAFTLARGKNNLNFDIYRTDSTDLGYAINGFFIVTYTSAKPTGGYGAANHTVRWSIKAFQTEAPTLNIKATALATSIPETNYFINSYGGVLRTIVYGTTSVYGYQLLMEKTASSGQWAVALSAPTQPDPEQGLHSYYFDASKYVYRWDGDLDTDRVDVETSRRWWFISILATSLFSGEVWVTYHTNTFTVADSISGFSGTVNIGLHRGDAANSDTGELVKTTSRTGDGAFSMTWYDSASQVYVSANDGTNVGRSTNDYAS